MLVALLLVIGAVVVYVCYGEKFKDTAQMYSFLCKPTSCKMVTFS